MAEELSELDALIESDVLEALGEKVAQEDSSSEIDGITIEDVETPSEVTQENVQEETLEEQSSDEPTPTPEEISELQDSEEVEDAITIEDLNEPLEVAEETVVPEETIEPAEACEIKEEKVQTVTSTDLTSLLSELLNNKTIEITIKIKD